jgi:DNA relaxase NicK
LDVSTLAHSQAVVRFKSAANTPKPSLWIGGEGGITAYLGDRTSSYFGRIYDKEVESQDVAYTGCWRYEVECKAAVAAEVARMAEGAQDLVAFAASYVWGWWYERGIQPIYTAGDAYREATSTRHSIADENTLGWLRQAVRPSVERLLGRGRILEVYDALGLTI